MTDQAHRFKQWCILELLGHVRLAGLVTEEDLFGSKIGRIDIPSPDGQGFVTQYFSSGAIYRLTPTTEEIAHAVARVAPAPISRWELTAALAKTTEDVDEPRFMIEEGEEDDPVDFNKEDT